MHLTIFFIVINVIVFLLQQTGILSGMAFTPALFIHQPWTILTSIFMHNNLQHLMFNMLGLFMFGSVVEKELGKTRWLILYFFAGFAGSFLYMLLSPSPFISALGASGAIFGLIGGAALLKPKMIIWTNFGPLPMIVAALGWAIAEFVGLFGVDTIAQSAHIGGLIGGGIMALVLLTRIDDKYLSAAILIPIILSIAVGLTLPSEIPDYTQVPEGFVLNSSESEFRYKQNQYTNLDNHIYTITSPSRGDFNLAEYSRFLEHTTYGLYTELYGKPCQKNFEYKVGINGDTAIIQGIICDNNFKAVSRICPKNIDVRIIDFYQEQPHIGDVVSCT